MKTNSFTNYHNHDCAPIIIYGAGACGRLTQAALHSIGLNASFFCDKALAGSEFAGTAIIPPERLVEFPDAHVLIASSTYYKEMLEFLVQIQHAKYYDVLELISDPRLLSGKSLEEQFDLHNLVTTYLFEVVYNADSDKVNLFTLDIVVTEKCSLRCKDCANAMQYYDRPQDCELQTIEASFDRYLESVDYLPRAFFIGGEPFLNRDLYKLINRFGGHPKIGAIWIFTNGSVTPNRNLLDAMKVHKVMVRLSDYGPLVKNKEAFVRRLEAEGIPHKALTCDVWQDLGPMKDRHYSMEQIQAIYRSCECRDIFTLLKGKLYHCPWSAHGANLGRIAPWPEDCVDLMDGTLSREEIATRIRHLKNDCLCIAACGYCNGRGAFAPSIPAAVQRSR